MCDPASITVAALSAAATIGSSVISAQAQKKAAKISAQNTPKATTPINSVEQTANTLSTKRATDQPTLRNLGALNQNFNTNPINTYSNIGSDYNNVGLNIGG